MTENLGPFFGSFSISVFRGREPKFCSKKAKTIDSVFNLLFLFIGCNQANRDTKDDSSDLRKGRA
jgi:hypothetical protein